MTLMRAVGVTVVDLFFFQAEDGIRDLTVTGVQTCALPISDLVAQGRPATVVAERSLRRDGLELACEWTMTPLVDDDNQIVSVILQGRDITQQDRKSVV